MCIRTAHQMFPENHHHPPLLNLDLQRERQPHEHFLFPLAIQNLPFDSGHSTLYTSLPHAQLKKQLHDLLERVFNTKGKSFIATNNFRTFWANDKTSTRYTYFSCRELGLAIDFLIDNIYVRFGSSVFRQVIGIPMGTNSAPLLADLLLHSSATPFDISTTYSVLTM